MIHEYGYKPNPVFGYRGRENGKRTYGVELECEPAANGSRVSPEHLSDTLDEISSRIYCKHDGSLYNGVEIVSHPGTLNHHTYQLRWKALCQAAIKAGFRSHDTANCGLHVHVGRDTLGPDSDDVTRKLTVLVYRHWPELVNFTRRRESALDQWASRPDVSYTVCRMYARSGDEDWLYNRAEDEIPAYDCHHDDRYTAVNVTNENTVEIRIFRGTLKRDTIIATLQLVDNLCEYAATHTWTEVLGSTWSDVSLLKQYPELDAYLVARNLAPTLAPEALAAITARRTPELTGADGIIPGVTAAA